MRFLSPLLVSMVFALASCSTSPSTPSGSSQAAASTSANLQAGATTRLDAAGVEKLVRDRLKDSQVETVQSEMKDVQWVANNLGLAGNTLPLTAPVWIVVAKGTIRGSQNADLAGDLSTSFTTANFVVTADTGEFIRTQLGGRQPVKLVSAKIGAAAAEQAVRDRFKSSQLDAVSSELKTYQWAADNLSYEASMYTMDSLVWIVTATGKIQGDANSVEPGATPPTFKTGKFAVDTETGMIFSLNLYPKDFIPQAVAPRDPQSNLETNFLSPLRPSPHP